MGADAVCEFVSQLSAHQRPSTAEETPSQYVHWGLVPWRSASLLGHLRVCAVVQRQRLPLTQADLTLSFAACLTDDEPFMWNQPLRRRTSPVELLCILGHLVGVGERWVGMNDYKGLRILIPEKDAGLPFPCASILEIT